MSLAFRGITMAYKTKKIRSPADGKIDHNNKSIPAFLYDVKIHQHIHMKYIGWWLGIILCAMMLSCGMNMPLDPINDDGHFGWRVVVHATLSNEVGDSTLTKYRLTLDGEREDVDSDTFFDPPRSTTTVHGLWDFTDGPGEHTLSVTIRGQTTSPNTYTLSNTRVSLNELEDWGDLWDGGECVNEIRLPNRTALMATGDSLEFQFTL